MLKKKHYAGNNALDGSSEEMYEQVHEMSRNNEIGKEFSMGLNKQKIMLKNWRKKICKKWWKDSYFVVVDIDKNCKIHDYLMLKRKANCLLETMLQTEFPNSFPEDMMHIEIFMCW